MNNQVTRQYAKLVSSSAHPLPDPLHGLSAFERRSILFMGPTWSERHRMCQPGISKENRRDILLNILFERRHAYDLEFHARCKAAELERANNRYLYNEQHLTNFMPAISTSLTAMHSRRREQDQRERLVREQYYRLREERIEDEDQPKRKRKKSLRMSR